VPLHLVEHVRRPLELGRGGVETLLRLVAAHLVPGDPRGLVDHLAPLGGGRGDHLVHLPLLDERVEVAADARVEEQIDHVATAHARLVQQVLARPRPVQTPRDLHLAERGPVARERLVVGRRQRERDLGVADRLAVDRSAEDHVGHLGAAQRSRRLLADTPPQRVHDVGFSAAVRTDDDGDPGAEMQGRAIREGLEAVQVEAEETHPEADSS
jgi:hypothetical protein